MTSFLTHMVESNPGQAHQFWAIFLADQADYAGAIAHMREALAIERNLGLHVSVADMHNSLGYFLTQRAQNGDLEEALKEYQTAAELDPEDATPFFNLGNVYTKRREFGKAVQKFEQALKLEPKNAKFHATLAKILSRIGREQEAESSFQKSDRD